MSTQPSAGLAQEIYDEFLMCKICFAAYKHPKSLDCLHTFCAKCIDNRVKSESTYKRYTDSREFTCPLCHQRTHLPPGGAHKLLDNFTVCGLLDVVGPLCSDASRGSACDICKRVNHRHREAAFKCLDCVKLLCSDCSKEHREVKVTSGHSVFGIQVEKEAQCKEHPEEVVRFYCIPCDACICVLCTFKQHLDHKVIQFTEAVSNCKEHIAALLALSRDKASDFDSRVEAISKCEEVISSTVLKIKAAATEYIQNVRREESKLLDKLHQMVGTEVTSQLETKKDLVAVAEGMRRTCEITDIILDGKEMELLLLKKDVEVKLASIIDVQVNELPSEYGSNIEFFPGTVHFGYLCDRDKPFVSSVVRVKKQVRANYVDSTTGQQTDYVTLNEVPLGKRSETGIQTEDCEVFQPNNSQVEYLSTKVQKCAKADDMAPEIKDFNVRASALSSTDVVTPPAKSQQSQNEQEPRRRRRRDPTQSVTSAVNSDRNSEVKTE